MDIETYAICKKKIAEAIEGVTQFSYEVVEELPETGESGVIYLILAGVNIYDEYVWSGSGYLRIGVHYDITNTTTDVEYIMED